jgi:hypothetical protein
MVDWGVSGWEFASDGARLGGGRTRDPAIDRRMLTAVRRAGFCRSRREEELEALLEALRIRAVLDPRRHADVLLMEALQALPKHRTIALTQHTRCDMHNAGGINAEDMSVVGQMVNRAEREAVANDGRAVFLAVLDDMSRLQERALA